MERFIVTTTAIPELYAVWDTVIEDYETTRTLFECEKFCSEHNK